MENEELKWSILEKDAAIKAISECFLDLKSRIATTKIDKIHASELNTDLLESTSWKGVESTRMKNGRIETVPPKYLGFSFHIRKSYSAVLLQGSFQVFSIYFEVEKKIAGADDDAN